MDSKIKHRGIIIALIVQLNYILLKLLGCIMGNIIHIRYIGLFILFAALVQPVVGQADYQQQIQFIDSVGNFSFQHVTTNPNEAEESLTQALVLADSLNYKEGQARLLEQLSWASSYLGNWEESIARRIKSIRIYEELDMMIEAGYGFAELGYGVRRRSHERAEYFMLQGIDILEEFPTSTELANAYNNYGIVKLEQDQIDSAIYYVEKSLAIKEANKDTLGIAYSYGYLGSAYQEMQEYEKADTYLQDSYQLKKMLHDSSGMAIDLTNIASNFYYQGNTESAVNYFKRSLQMALAIDYHHLAEHNYNQIAQLFEETGQYDSALHYQKQFSQFRQERVDESTNARIAELEVQFETEQKEKELAIQRAELNARQLQIRNRNWILTALGGVLLFGGIITAMVIRQQKIKQRENELQLKLTKAETENRIHKERERISRDLHDNVGAQITSLISGLEISNFYVKKNKTDDALGLIGTLSTNARDAMSELRETIWLLNKNNIRIGDFIRHLKKYIEKQEASLGKLRVSIDNRANDNLELSTQQSLHILRIIQEALANCVKYAEANQFEIRISQEGDQLHVFLCDDGIGLNGHSSGPTNNEYSGNGLRNMKRRADDLKGTLKVGTNAGKGFGIELLFPVETN